MTGNRRRWLPTAIVVITVAALGVAARRTGGLDSGVAQGVAKDLRPLVALAATVALVIVATTYAKHRDDGYGPLHRAGTATAVLIGTAAVVTPVGLLFFGRESTHESSPVPRQDLSTTSTPSPSSSQSRHPTLHAGKSSHWSADIAQIVLYVLLVAVVALVLYYLARLLRDRRLIGPGQLLMEFDELTDADLEQLADAVEAGNRALAYQGDAREAVIACYAAMEDALSAQGNGRREVDTPEDFLKRVTGARLIPVEPARRLTELFGEARFSRHAIDEDKRNQARAALEAIGEHLRKRAEEIEAARAAATGSAAASSAAASSTASGGTAATSTPGARR